MKNLNKVYCIYSTLSSMSYTKYNKSLRLPTPHNIIPEKILRSQNKIILLFCVEITNLGGN